MNEDDKGRGETETTNDEGVSSSDLLSALSKFTNDWENLIEKVGDIKGVDGNINAAIIIPMQRMVMDVRKLIINHSA